MATRITQNSKSVSSEVSFGKTRVTQVSRVSPVDMGTSRLGGTAHVTQISKVIIAARPVYGGGLMLLGVGS